MAGKRFDLKKLSVRHKLLAPSLATSDAKYVRTCTHGDGCSGPSSTAEFLEILFFSQIMVASLDFPAEARKLLLENSNR